jgi:hypothetical protein
VIAGLVVDHANIMKQGKQACDFIEAPLLRMPILSGSIANSSIPTTDRPGEARRQSERHASNGADALLKLGAFPSLSLDDALALLSAG